MSTSDVIRCSWCGDDELYVRYHDEEWGVPMHDDRALFEMLTLEGAQAGLSWYTVLVRREGYRKAFEGFDIERVAAFDEAKVDELVLDPGIIRHRGKILATIKNAKAVLDVQREFGSLDKYLWSFVGGQTLDHRCKELSDIPATSPESIAMSKALAKRGFGFVGPTICYAFMQASGMVNDHLVSCFRH